MNRPPKNIHLAKATATIAVPTLLVGLALAFSGGEGRAPATDRATARTSAVSASRPIQAAPAAPIAVAPPPEEEEEEDLEEPSRQAQASAPGVLHIGVHVVDLTSAQSADLGLPAGRGAVIDGVVAHSQASRSNLLPGDVILAVAGQPVQRAQDVSRIVQSQRAGWGVPMDIVRRGVRYTAQIVPLAVL